MSSRIFLVCALLLPAVPASGQEDRSNGQQSPDVAYHTVMKAQYEAREPAPPMRADEAQRIYDAYLSTIGRPDNHRISDDETDRPQRWPGP